MNNYRFLICKILPMTLLSLTIVMTLILMSAQKNEGQTQDTEKGSFWHSFHLSGEINGW